MKERLKHHVACEIFANPCPVWLKQAWCELEQRAEPNFFLSWLWIGTWLDSFVDDFWVIEARKQGKTVGLGVIVKNPPHFPSFREKYFLHRTGNLSHDQIWIEYNDFLLDTTEQEVIRQKMVECLVYTIDRRGAIVIGASLDETFQCISQLGLTKRKIWETKNYAIDLTELRSKGQTVLESLSRNSRSQILRSLRNYRQIGEISLHKAQTVDEAKSLLIRAKPLHLARWNEQHPKSGFANHNFVTFHERLIERGISSGAVELYHVKAGNETLSIIYNFHYNNRIYFYLCAINYCHTSAQYKPGLVSHYLLIDKALNEGIACYDFMGGDARYKASFSNRQGELSVSQFEHPSMLLSFEGKFRFAKEWIVKKRNREFYS
ncbi:GNAT family N-acetyltransferase [Enterovibrio paralichthyis]|uniref:GNAT family N-acetyltransferase n=1 Tax=Enterovibrio paralichthyis TaxID=2853805 RepID=UPI001C46FE2A|nr:GNAT family N-acetyltransferase [Enterovibrio paralichthyis]MBV7299791.1 GNAT family N-acetyltransferase [Enterovibrio paralichthyis]